MNGIFDDISNFASKEYNAAKGFVSQEYNQATAYGSKQYNDLKALVKTWAGNVVKLMNMPVPKALAGEKASLLSRAKTIKMAAEKIFGKIDNLNSLGFIPIVAGITLAAIAGATALIVHWIADYKSFSLKVDVYDKASKQGATPAQAAKIAETVSNNTPSGSNTKEGIIDKAKKYLPIIGVSIILLVFKDEIFKGVKSVTRKGRK